MQYSTSTSITLEHDTVLLQTFDKFKLTREYQGGTCHSVLHYDTAKQTLLEYTGGWSHCRLTVHIQL